MNHSERSGWARAPLSALGILVSGQSPTSSLVNHEGIGTPYVSGPEQWTDGQVVIDKWTAGAGKIVPERSIFIVVKGAGVGTVFPGTRAAIGRDIVAFVPYEPLDRDYFILTLRERCKEIIEEARGHIPGLTRSLLLNIWLDVPPLAEQGRIKKRILAAEDLLKQSEDQLRIAKANARDLRNITFIDAFSGKDSEDWRRIQGQTVVDDSAQISTADSAPDSGSVLRGRYGLALGRPGGSVPPGWSWSRLVDIAQLRTGHTPSRREPDYWDGDIPWIGITDARENYGNVINDTEQHITRAGLENSSADVLPTGTLCLSRTASLGYVVVTGRPMTTSQDFLNWTCGTSLDGSWLLWLFIAERESFQDFGRGSTHKTIYMEDAQRLCVLLPPLGEQREIVRLIESSLSRLDEIDVGLGRAQSEAVRMRDSTLAAALSGELDTGRASDQVADILLSELRENVQVDRSEPVVDLGGPTGGAAVSVDRLIRVVSESSAGLSPEKLFASAGYRTDALSLFFAHIKSAVETGAVSYNSLEDRVVADET